MFNTIISIIQKDLFEIFRNKRAVISALFLPALFIPFLVYFQPFLSLTESQDIRVAVYDYRIDKSDVNFIETIKKDDRLKIEFIDTDRINENKFDLSLIIHQNDYRKKQVMLIYNSSSSHSQKAFEYISSSIINSEITDMKTDITDLGEFDTSNTQAEAASSPFTAYPWIFLMFGFSGAAFVASEIVSGEKERHTLETLFSLQINRSHILSAKYLAILLFSMFNFAFNLLIMAISVTMMKTMPLAQLFNESFSVTIAVLPALILLSGILLYISLKAKSIHEARSVESVFFLVFSALIIGSSFLSFGATYLTQLLPFINTIIIIQTMQFDAINAILLIISTIIPTLFIFKRCQVFILKDGVLDTVTNPDKGRLKKIFPLLIMLFVYVLFMSFSDIWTNESYAYRTIMVQASFFLIPALVLIALRKNPDRWQTFKSLPSIRQILISIGFTSILFLGINYYQSIFNELFGVNNILSDKSLPLQSIWQSMVIMCLVPALSEELFFRAYFAEHWFNKNDRRGIFISAIVFVLFHQNYHEFFSLFILGIWFAYLLYQYRNIWLAMVAHFVNNAFVVMISYYQLEFYKKHFIGSISILLIVLTIYFRKKVKENTLNQE
ncbi:MAG: ABC transporter permease subunit [Candidatus Cloacimonadales bacterium]|nr:ABC transporter permease subunit [Candidatus Cloacimonadales bacterium]